LFWTWHWLPLPLFFSFLKGVFFFYISFLIPHFFFSTRHPNPFTSLPAANASWDCNLKLYHLPLAQVLNLQTRCRPRAWGLPALWKSPSRTAFPAPVPLFPVFTASPRARWKSPARPSTFFFTAVPLFPPGRSEPQEVRYPSTLFPSGFSIIRGRCPFFLFLIRTRRLLVFKTAPRRNAFPPPWVSGFEVGSLPPPFPGWGLFPKRFTLVPAPFYESVQLERWSSFFSSNCQFFSRTAFRDLNFFQ